MKVRVTYWSAGEAYDARRRVEDLYYAEAKVDDKVVTFDFDLVEEFEEFLGQTLWLLENDELCRVDDVEVIA